MIDMIWSSEVNSSTLCVFGVGVESSSMSTCGVRGVTSGDMTSFPPFPYCRPPRPVISAHFRSSWRHFRPIYNRFTPILRHFRCFPIIAHHIRSLLEVITSFPIDVRPFYDEMASYPVFPYFRPLFLVISGRHDVISDRRTTVSGHFRYFPIIAQRFRSFPVTSGRHDVISRRSISVLWRLRAN